MAVPTDLLRETMVVTTDSLRGTMAAPGILQGKLWRPQGGCPKGSCKENCSTRLRAGGPGGSRGWLVLAWFHGSVEPAEQGDSVTYILHEYSGLAADKRARLAKPWR